VPEELKQWHLDRKFSVGLALTVLAQTVGIIWWAATLSSTVSELRVVDARHDALMGALSAGREANASRITALETKGTSIEAKLVRIEDKLDRLLEERRQQP
jgi:hypothetical protein